MRFRDLTMAVLDRAVKTQLHQPSQRTALVGQSLTRQGH
jgi:hypothetical protein